MNVIFLRGRLGKDPEMRSTSNGKAVCSFSIGVNEGWGDKKSTSWHNIVAWDKKAEAINTYFVKGMEIIVIGRQVNRSYDDKDGNKRYVSEVVLTDFEFCGGKKDDERAEMPTGAPAEQPQTDDDLPF